MSANQVPLELRAPITSLELLALMQSNEDLLTALEKMVSASDKLVYRPSIDDSRQIDRDTTFLREVTNSTRIIAGAQRLSVNLRSVK